MTTNPRSLAYDETNHRLICEKCTEWTDFDDLYVDNNGDKLDICRWCGTPTQRPQAAT